MQAFPYPAALLAQMLVMPMWLAHTCKTPKVSFTQRYLNDVVGKTEHPLHISGTWNADCLAVGGAAGLALMQRMKIMELCRRWPRSTPWWAARLTSNLNPDPNLDPAMQAAWRWAARRGARWRSA